MNEKFWNLKKEKQDRMINASMKVFSENGYENACTDVIVKEAGISKGLLFHYFESKAGAYSFAIGYGVKYIKLELSSFASKKGDFYDKAEGIALAKSQLMKQHPYLMLFLDSAIYEKKDVISEDLRETLSEYDSFMRSLYLGKDEDGNIPDETTEYKLIKYLELGAMNSDIKEGSANGSLFLEEMNALIGHLKGLRK